MDRLLILRNILELVRDDPLIDNEGFIALIGS